jgi:hypothetical protein
MTQPRRPTRKAAEQAQQAAEVATEAKSEATAAGIFAESPEVRAAATDVIEAAGEVQQAAGEVEAAAAGGGGGNGGNGGRRLSDLPGVRRVSLEPSEVPSTSDEFLWWAIRDRQEAVSFARYKAFIDTVLCSRGKDRAEFGGAPIENLLADIQGDRPGKPPDTSDAVEGARKLLFSGEQFIDRVRGYQILKEATELWLMVEAGLATSPNIAHAKVAEVAKALSRLGPRDPLNLGNYNAYEFAKGERERYLERLGDGYQGLPYIRLILDQLGALPLKPGELVYSSSCYGIQYEEVNRPVMLELIWSYWMEQGMLAQTLAALSLRFQNKKLGARDPLANLEIDPLRGVANLLWGYIQDEPNRLTVQRRAYEYVHQYGLELTGAAVPRLEAADRRTQFLRSFHDLLTTAYEFYQADDDTTVHADPFPVLSALQTLHMVLAEGAHNQFGDLTWTSRVEMLCQQWILARPELREFLPVRNMVPYREPWMDRVDAMRTVQDWGDVSITHFRDLATYGEMLLLTVRWGEWSTIIDPDNAANWARAWRPMVQMYLHAYKAVTGVDLTAQSTATFTRSERYAQPSYHLERMIKAGSRNGARAQRVTAPTR